MAAPGHEISKEYDKQKTRVKGTLFVHRSFGLKRKLTRGCERVRVSEMRGSGMSDKGLWRTGN